MKTDIKTDILKQGKKGRYSAVFSGFQRFSKTDFFVFLPIERKENRLKRFFLFPLIEETQSKNRHKKPKKRRKYAVF